MPWKACKIKFEREPDLRHCLSQKSHHDHHAGHDLPRKRLRSVITGSMIVTFWRANLPAFRIYDSGPLVRTNNTTNNDNNSNSETRKSIITK